MGKSKSRVRGSRWWQDYFLTKLCIQLQNLLSWYWWSKISSLDVGFRWLNVALNIHKIARLSFQIFKNFLGRGSPSPLPRTLPPLFLGLRSRFRLRPQISGFAFKSRALRALDSGFALKFWTLSPPLPSSPLPSPPLPSPPLSSPLLPSPPLPFPFLPSPSLPFPPLPSPPLPEGALWAPPAGSGAGPQPPAILVHFRSKRKLLVQFKFTTVA